MGRPCWLKYKEEFIIPEVEEALWKLLPFSCPSFLLQFHRTAALNAWRWSSPSANPQQLLTRGGRAGSPARLVLRWLERATAADSAWQADVLIHFITTFNNVSATSCKIRDDGGLTRALWIASFCWGARDVPHSTVFSHGWTLTVWGNTQTNPFKVFLFFSFSPH